MDVGRLHTFAISFSVSIGGAVCILDGFEIGWNKLKVFQTAQLSLRLQRPSKELKMQIKDKLRNSAYATLRILTGPGNGIRAVLTYHSVGVDASYSVRNGLFEKQIEFLKSRFQIVLLKELREAISSTDSNTGIACITFDDGYKDNYEKALPILERYKVKASFFIATGFLGSVLKTSSDERQMMNASQVRELARLGHEIGAHTISHPKLTEISLEAARKEIQESKKILQELTGDKLSSFAYPKGCFSHDLKTIVAECGFSYAVITSDKLLSEPIDWLAIPRVGVFRSLDMAAFKARLSPAGALYDTLRIRKLTNA